MSSEFYFGLICLNHLERSLLNSVLTVGMIVICFIHYILAEKFGRRIALTITMLVLIVSKFGQIIIKEAWYPHQHYSIFYIRRILMTSGKMSIVHVSGGDWRFQKEGVLSWTIPFYIQLVDCYEFCHTLLPWRICRRISVVQYLCCLGCC